jgi:hypothetical protein
LVMRVTDASKCGLSQMSIWWNFIDVLSVEN